VLREHVRDRFHDGWMIVRDEHRGHCPFRHRGLRSLRRGSDSVEGEHERSAAAIKQLRLGHRCA
jgi:hypothetical protein